MVTEIATESWDNNDSLQGIQIECTTDDPEESKCILMATSSDNSSFPKIYIIKLLYRPTISGDLGLEIVY